MEEAKFNQSALEWWPFLKTIVQNINRAAKSRDRILLESTLVKAINGLGMEIKNQEIRPVNIITVAELKKILQEKIEEYKFEVKNVISKRKRLEGIIEGRGPLKPITAKQYQSIIKKWPEKQKKLKEEIRELKTRIKDLRSSKMLEFKNGMVLTIHRGGKYQVSQDSGSTNTATIISEEDKEIKIKEKEVRLFDFKTFNFWPKEPSKKNELVCAYSIYLRMKDLAKADQESFWIIGLNNRFEEFFCDCVSIGGIKEARVDKSIVFKRLLAVGVPAFICVHNHPGGNPKPSQDDIQMTKDLRESAKVVGLRLLDHIIIGDDTYVSLAEERLI